MKRKEIITLFWVSMAVSMFFLFCFYERQESGKLFIYHSDLHDLFFCIGWGNGLLNNFLNKKIPWSEATTKRAVISIVSIVVVNFILVYFCNYINFVLIQKGATTEEFFPENTIT